jgi:hypothetical protein
VVSGFSRTGLHSRRDVMITIEAVQLRRLASEVLRQLGVDESTRLVDIRELVDGTWMVDFEDRSPETRFPSFAIAIQQEWTRDDVLRALRLELRDKLWICALCQQRARIRRIMDGDASRIECGQCGRFEIENAWLDRLRVALEDRDPTIIAQLPTMSAIVRSSSSAPSLSAENWNAILNAGNPRC